MGSAIPNSRTGLLGALALANVRVRTSRVFLVTGFVMVTLILGGIKAAPRILERAATAGEGELEDVRQLVARVCAGELVAISIVPYFASIAWTTRGMTGGRSAAL